MAVAQHTEWEKKQLESIELFLKQAIQTIDYFVEKDKELRDAESDEDGNRSADWLKFRGIVLDLYSVLDYVWYMLYCHFSNKGQPDLSEKGCELGFPYKKRGIKTSVKPEHDQTKKFVKEKLKMIWGDKIGEETHFWREIGETIVSVQPKLTVDSSGAPIGKAEVRPGVEESLALLHFYRNCAAHKDLITFMSKKSFVEINQTTRETRLVTEMKDDHEGYFYKDLDKGFWIQLPGSISSSIYEPNRLLVDVLKQLQNFVVSTASRLLRSALLLPSAKSILVHHVHGCRLTTESQDRQEANVTATMTNGRAVVKTAANENYVYAEEDACVQIVKSLPQHGILPNSPYSCFASHYVCPHPQVQRLEGMLGGTPQELLDDWKQKLEAGNMEVIVEDNKHILVKSKQSGAIVFKLSSEMDGSNSDSAKEAAANKLIKEGIRLGLIEVTIVECPPLQVQTLMKSASKTYRMVLNEFKQKVDNLNMRVYANYSGPHEVEQSCYETELSLTIIRRGDNKKVLQISSDKQKRRGKNESKEAAAQQVIEECEKKGIIKLLPQQ